MGPIFVLFIGIELVYGRREYMRGVRGEALVPRRRAESGNRLHKNGAMVFPAHYTSAAVFRNRGGYFVPR